MTPQTFDPNKMKVVNPSDVKPVYSNNAACMMTPHDLRIIFHEIVLDGPADPARVELRANVTMSPTQFKALSVAITQTLSLYEQQNGIIQWPPKPPKTN